MMHLDHMSQQVQQGLLKLPGSCTPVLRGLPHLHSTASASANAHSTLFQQGQDLYVLNLPGSCAPVLHGLPHLHITASASAITRHHPKSNPQMPCASAAICYCSLSMSYEQASRLSKGPELMHTMTPRHYDMKPRLMQMYSSSCCVQQQAQTVAEQLDEQAD